MPPLSANLTEAVNCYRQEWQPAKRLKGGLPAIIPLYLRDEARIRGLLLLLGIALPVLTLTGFVARRNLAARGENPNDCTLGIQTAQLTDRLPNDC